MTIPNKRPKAKGNDLYKSKQGHMSFVGERSSSSFTRLHVWQRSWWPWKYGKIDGKATVDRRKGTVYELTFQLPGEFFY